MPLKCGIVGLPNSGKSTLFNAITKAGAKVDSYPFTTIDPNIGIVDVPDNRLEELQKIVKAEKVISSTIEFFDIAGLVEGASKGEGLGNQFLSHIRGTDLYVHLVRCFDEDIPHINKSIDPLRDIEIIELELFSSDLEILGRRIEKLKSRLKKGDTSVKEQIDVLDKVLNYIKQGKIPPEELNKNLPEDINLITTLPCVFAANTGEKEKTRMEWIECVEKEAKKRNTECIVLNAKIEKEIFSLDDEERKEFLEIYNIDEPGTFKLIRAVYKKLGLITFYTFAGGKELRAWALKEGSTAFDAAGKIHTDFQKHFIKAEVIKYENFIRSGCEAVAREKGFINTAGRDYLVQDGDIITFRVGV